LTVTGTEQRVYGTLVPSVRGTLILIPILAHWPTTSTPPNTQNYVVFPDVELHLPKLSTIYRITLVNEYSITGNVKQRDIDPYGYVTFDQQEDDTNNNYVSLYGCAFDDVFWIKNQHTNKEIILYCGNGYEATIQTCTFNGEPNISYIFDLETTTTTTITVSLSGSDFWGISIGGTVNYIAIDCSFPDNPFVKHPYTYYAYAYYKKYGWTGHQLN